MFNSCPQNLILGYSQLSSTPKLLIYWVFPCHQHSSTMALLIYLLCKVRWTLGSYTSKHSPWSTSPALTLCSLFHTCLATPTILKPSPPVTVLHRCKETMCLCFSFWPKIPNETYYHLINPTPSLNLPFHALSYVLMCQLMSLLCTVH